MRVTLFQIWNKTGVSQPGQQPIGIKRTLIYRGYHTIRPGTYPLNTIARTITSCLS